MAIKRFKGDYCFKVDPGKVRINNEDRANVVVNHKGDVFLIVCDGIGGQSKGDFASKMAVDFISDAFLEMNPNLPLFVKSKLLKQAIREVNKMIYDESFNNPECKGMGTTVVCALISKRRLIVANAGDSRAYLINNHSVSRLTSDQTYVNYLFRTGRISESEINTHPERHVLMNAIGTFPSLSIDMKTYKYSGEGILLCSDGLYNGVDEKEIFAVLRTDDRVEQKVTELIAEANNNGGPDNIAIALWETNND